MSQTGHMKVGVQLQLGPNAKHVRINNAVLDYDHAHAALRTRAIVFDNPLRNRSILVGVAHSHGRHHDAVLHP